MPVRLLIRFGPTKSPGIQDAVRLASTLASYQEVGGVHSVDEEIRTGNWDALFGVWSLTSHWSATRCSLNGRPPEFRDMAELQGVFKCHEERRQSGDTDRHCTGRASPTDDPKFLGCRYARGARLAFDGSNGLRQSPPEWWRFGTLQPDLKSFTVRKDLILKQVEAQSANAAASACPAWSMERVREVVKLLPPEIFVGEKWRLRYSDLEETHALGVEPRITLGCNLTVTEDGKLEFP